MTWSGAQVAGSAANGNERRAHTDERRTKPYPPGITGNWRQVSTSPAFAAASHQGVVPHEENSAGPAADPAVASMFGGVAQAAPGDTGGVVILSRTC